MDSHAFTTPTEQTLWSIEQILETLDSGPKPNKPEAIRQARLQRDAIVPRLIEAIESAVNEIELGSYTDRGLPFFALFLLTEFKAKQALPTILKAVSLPDDGDYDIFGGAVTNYLYVTFSTLADDSFELVEQLILNRSIDQFVRWAAITSYLNLFQRRLMTREQVIETLYGYLEIAITTSDSELATCVVTEILNYAPTEALPTIEKAYAADVVDETIVDLEDVYDSLKEGEDFMRREVERRAYAEPPDTIEFLDEWWNVFRDPEPVRIETPPPLLPPAWSVFDENDDFYSDDREPVVETIRNTAPKVGRNDPCLCGSGKKYKKCCGKT